ncbi:hypothetical protein C8K11_111107 [Novosphingobium sp. GV055]|nr:hypothetical protein C8K11_111107 [Novosphingobium sp. GV055]PUB01384.1 hypothetical protein C8K12_111107 [Novosphingobium sp. GV061]PUB16958.1 hypothetical protein C8K14_111107 [Novosphingobium sp. GV079]PUB39981.1 hypothetical protein C8K10_111107 [Novosphingobium sp. GV027]
MWDHLIPVIIGGLIGVSGGLAGPPLTHYLQKKKDDRALYRTRLEEAILLLWRHRKSINDEVNAAIRLLPEPFPDEYGHQLYAICAIYFPEIGNELKNLIDRTADLYVWTFEVREVLKGNPNAEIDASFNAAYDPFDRAVNEVTMRFKQIAERFRIRYALPELDVTETTK